MPINLISGLLFMEKNMKQIYRKKFPHGSHTVYCQYGGMGDLTLSSFHYGSDVEGYWGNDEYEYYFTILKSGVSKFFINCLAKGFNSNEKFTLKNLKEMCDKLNIQYTTNSYV